MKLFLSPSGEEVNLRKAARIGFEKYMPYSDLRGMDDSDATAISNAFRAGFQYAVTGDPDQTSAREIKMFGVK